MTHFEQILIDSSVHLTRGRSKSAFSNSVVKKERYLVGGVFNKKGRER
ncbi:hypothetical protein VCR6J2_470055 [Vibrio coralliirubri]|nr:hypothetical protein VCR6J2_470055 [Vibrio coralliirubri]